MKLRKQKFKRAALVVAALVGLVIAWYGQSRLLAPLRCVRLVELEVQTKAIPEREYLQVAAYNIAHGRGGKYGASNWTGETEDELMQRLNCIADQVKEAGVDILVLNEVDFKCSWSHKINQARIIAQSGGFHYCIEQRNYDAAFPFRKYCFGNAILSKFPVNEQRAIYFKALSKKERIFAGNHDGVLATVETPLGDLRILAVHLDARNEDVSVECARNILEIVKENGIPLIAMGDYNSTPEGYPNHRKSTANVNAMDVLLKSGLLRVSDGLKPEQYRTFPSEDLKRAIDWILSTAEITQQQAKAVPSDYSDHLMVTARINIAK